MTAAATATPSRKSRSKKPLEAVDPAVAIVAYCTEEGLGVIEIDGRRYVMRANRHEGRTVGMRLTRRADKGEPGFKHIDVGFFAEGWTCDCEDATYSPERPGGCKHVVSLRKAMPMVRAMACKKPTA